MEAWLIRRFGPPPEGLLVEREVSLDQELTVSTLFMEVADDIHTNADRDDSLPERRRWGDARRRQP